jgi:hypothetical protein
MNSWGIFVLMAWVVSCGRPDESEPARVGIVQEFQGEEFRLQVRFPALADFIEFKFDGRLRLFAIDSQEQSLTQDEQDAIKLTLDEMRMNPGTDVQTQDSRTLIMRVLDYLAQAPPGHVLKARRFKSKGIRCIKKDDSVRAEWTTHDNQPVYETIIVGESRPHRYGCMGRCGVDCGWGAPSAWTQDCLDHDACSYQKQSKSKRHDLDCGDEFDQAADDWIAGTLVGCDGVRRG